MGRTCNRKQKMQLSCQNSLLVLEKECHQGALSFLNSKIMYISKVSFLVNTLQLILSQKLFGPNRDICLVRKKKVRAKKRKNTFYRPGWLVSIFKWVTNLYRFCGTSLFSYIELFLCKSQIWSARTPYVGSQKSSFYYLY